LENDFAKQNTKHRRGEARRLAPRYVMDKKWESIKPLANSDNFCCFFRIEFRAFFYCRRIQQSPTHRSETLLQKGGAMHLKRHFLKQAEFKTSGLWCVSLIIPSQLMKMKKK
jgi:hypothetical protein